jgi:FtsZ-interacting cell division protein ZipA
MEDLIKYKHYLILIITLAVVKIIIEPLWQNIQIERQALLLSEKRVSNRKANRKTGLYFGATNKN